MQREVFSTSSNLHFSTGMNNTHLVFKLYLALLSLFSVQSRGRSNNARHQSVSIVLHVMGNRRHAGRERSALALMSAVTIA